MKSSAFAAAFSWLGTPSIVQGIALCGSLMIGMSISACGDESSFGSPANAGNGGTAGSSGKNNTAGGNNQGGSSSTGGKSGTGGSSQQTTGGTGGTGGSSQQTTGGSAGTTGGGCEIDGQTHTGEATYYAADGTGNCSFDPSPQDLMVGAMNQEDYADSAVCGACVQLSGPNGQVRVRIVDRCPECKKGDIDLSPQAFEKIAALDKGRVPILWTYVACDVGGNLVYHFKDGSNPFWTAVQIRNHRYPISTFEYKGANGNWVKVTKLNYNYFVEDAGMGNGPYSFRVTDVLGHQIEDNNIALGDNVDRNGSQQFPVCQ
jgi:expansin